MEVGMDARTRCDRAAAAILAFVGVGLLGGAAATFAIAAPFLLGAEGEHIAGDATPWVMIVSLPQAIGALLTLLAAWLLWNGRPGGATLALVWVGLAGLATGMTYVATGNILSAVRMIVVESAHGWSVDWPTLAIATPDQGTYYSRLDDVTFWLPAFVALGALIVAGLLLTGSIAGRGRGATLPGGGRSPSSAS
jgi:hypothetical protein